MSNNHPTATTIQSIQRAVAILRSFTEAEPELSVTELSRRLGLHKSTVSRILSTLRQEGLVGQNPETDKYRLGLGLISLAGVALGRVSVRGATQPYLGTLVDISRETINVTVLDGQNCMNIEHVASPQPIRYVGWIGRRTPLHCTACGKVLLAYQSPEERAAHLPRRLTKHTDKTITNRSKLLASLAQIREQGYAIVEGEFEEGFTAIAAPIFNHAGEAVAAVSIAGPTYRLDEEHIASFIEPLKRITQTISEKLGYTGTKNVDPHTSF